VIPLFAYGTLRDGAYQRALFGRTFATASATLSGWRVVVGERGYFTVVADPSAHTTGDLVALDRRALALADGWEDGYRRLQVRARDAAGNDRACWLYVRPTASLTSPPPGATALHPPAEVLAAIRAYVATNSPNA